MSTKTWERFRKNRGAELGLYTTLLFVFLAVAAPWVSPHDPFEMGSRSFLAPQPGYWLGTDGLGRDTLARLLHGARVSLLVGFLAAGTSFVIGVAVGSFAGYFGGIVDSVLMRITEYFIVIPRFFLALLIVALLGTGIEKIIIVIGILSWPDIARVVRAQFLTFKEREFVLAAKATGQKDRQVIFGEILPNAVPPAIVVGSFLVAQAIILEAGLSFLGLGDPSVISWGTLLNDAREYVDHSIWLVVFPGVALSALVLAINLVGDGISDQLNPRLGEK